MDKPTITFTITKPLAVLYENDKGYTKDEGRKLMEALVQLYVELDAEAE